MLIAKSMNDFSKGSTSIKKRGEKLTLMDYSHHKQEEHI